MCFSGPISIVPGGLCSSLVAFGRCAGGPGLLRAPHSLGPAGRTAEHSGEFAPCRLIRFQEDSGTGVNSCWQSKSSRPVFFDCVGRIVRVLRSGWRKTFGDHSSGLASVLAPMSCVCEPLHSTNAATSEDLSQVVTELPGKVAHLVRHIEGPEFPVDLARILVGSQCLSSAKTAIEPRPSDCRIRTSRRSKKRSAWRSGKRNWFTPCRCR